MRPNRSTWQHMCQSRHDQGARYSLHIRWLFVYKTVLGERGAFNNKRAWMWGAAFDAPGVKHLVPVPIQHRRF
jgi:hypothetical protein